MPEGCILYLNYCYREHFKTLLPSDTQFQPLFQQSLINLEQNLIIVFCIPTGFYICAVEWSSFLKCHGRLLTKQKRAAIVTASKNFFGLSIHFQALLVAFVEQKKRRKQTQQNLPRTELDTCWPCSWHKKYCLNIYSVKQQTPYYKRFSLLFLLKRQMKFFQTSILTDNLNYK